MKTNKFGKSIMAMVVAVMMCMSLAACGSEEVVDASANGAEVVKVGTGNGMAPFCYLDEDGNPTGYDIDVLKEVDSRIEAYDFDIEAMDFSTLIVSIDTGSIDMLSHQLVKSETRREKYLFPEQYYSLSPMSLVVKVDSGIDTMADMKGKSTDQDPNAYEYQMLLAYNKAHPGEEIIINAVSDLTVADAFKKISNGQVDSYLTYSATFDTVINEIGIDNLKLTEVVMVEDTYMMLPKGNEALRDAVDVALKAMIEDGTLSTIAEKWLKEDIFTEYADMVTIVAE